MEQEQDKAFDFCQENELDQNDQNESSNIYPYDDAFFSKDDQVTINIDAGDDYEYNNNYNNNYNDNNNQNNNYNDTLQNIFNEYIINSDGELDYKRIYEEYYINQYINNEYQDFESELNIGFRNLNFMEEEFNTTKIKKQESNDKHFLYFQKFENQFDASISQDKETGIVNHGFEYISLQEIFDIQFQNFEFIYDDVLSTINAEETVVDKNKKYLLSYRNSLVNHIMQQKKKRQKKYTKNEYQFTKEDYYNDLNFFQQEVYRNIKLMRNLLKNKRNLPKNYYEQIKIKFYKEQYLLEQYVMLSVYDHITVNELLEVQIFFENYQHGENFWNEVAEESELFFDQDYFTYYNDEVEDVKQFYDVLKDSFEDSEYLIKYDRRFKNYDGIFSNSQQFQLLDFYDLLTQQ